jgi:molecular chaperone DnaK (HSP70)
MKKVYGIDLGTTYSAIATLDENEMPVIIENYVDGIPLLASAVYFPSGGKPVVGKEAKNQADVEPDRVVQWVKREIGKPNPRIREYDGVKYDPILISSLILKRMKEYAKEQGHEVDEVVITCPAYFGMEEHAATRQAGIIAGLNVIDIVNEPTAAALNYCYHEYRGKNEKRKIMVYDLGGGTFDITLFDFSVDENGNAVIDVIAAGGDDRLGGINWDDRLYDHMCELYSDENGIERENMDEDSRRKIKSEVEEVKKSISLLPNKGFNVSYEGEPTHLVVTREKFEELTRDLVSRTMDFVRQLLDDVGLSADDIDVVLLVGGSTLMPMIKAAVDGLFPGKSRVEQPHLAVAKGAALAAVLKVTSGPIPPTVSSKIGEEEPPSPLPEYPTGLKRNTIAFNDILTRSFGPAIFTEDGRYMIDNLLFVGDKTPSEATETYVTIDENQPAVAFAVFENVAKDRENKFVKPSLDEHEKEQDTDRALKVKNIGRVRLELPPNTPKGAPIEVTFRSSTVGLEVRATNLATGQSVESIITSENTKTQEEVDEARKRFASVKTSGQI